MLEKEFQYFRDHQRELFERYGPKYIVIVGEEVIGSYDTEIEAYNETRKTHDLGTFLIQECTDDPNVTIQTFHSRVSFE